MSSVIVPADTDPETKPEQATAGDDADKEPQNALTQKFTEKEWAALKEFRVRPTRVSLNSRFVPCPLTAAVLFQPLLPDVLEKAYEGKEDARTTPIVLWGVTLDPSGKKDARASVVLMKWLRARNLNVSEAMALMVDTLRWREEFNIESVMAETYPDVFDGFGHLYGRDKEGRPIMYNIYGRNNDLTTAFSDVQRFIRWRIALMEKGITLVDFETVDQIVQVHDYEGVGLGSRTTNSKAAASALSTIFQNHYPEFLAKKFFVNVPSIMTWIFWLFKPVLPPATLAKMKVVGHGPSAIGKELLPLIDVKELPTHYGGVVEDAW
ncbi:CRAL-TRIO domain-containing protein [Russula earlei]|uniref:CRAL-TRIO domain-containing protein n=1 Tax=Russula earlei TaxID=71964 RepID=A0ACC0TXC3_9AGAM|nr:CRAL-TRIO domain-containing protein [Russula earlei]